MSSLVNSINLAFEKQLALFKDHEKTREIPKRTVKSKSNIYITKNAVKALLARTYQYFGDKDKAISCTNALISSNKFDLFIDKDFSKLYNDRQTKESIFELKEVWSLVFTLETKSFLLNITKCTILNILELTMENKLRINK